jgi:CRISPR-associated RAMP protein (TIGR02581 family)
MMSADWVVTFVDLTLEAVSGVRVGVGRAPGTGAGTDLPLLRDHAGRPLIPGSSFKGVLRGAAERLLRGIHVGWACDPIRSPCVDPRDELDPTQLEERLCRACRLFGSQQRAARIQVGDLVSEGARTVVRDGVAINRAELKAAEQLKYDYEVVAPGALFRGRLRLDDPSPEELGLVLTVLDLLDAGLVTLGAGRAGGSGGSGWQSHRR